MTRFEEKLYLQSVFDAIDEVYQLNKHQAISSYEERLRTSLNKLLIPDWYNHDYTSVNALRKTKSHGQVPRVKRVDRHEKTNQDEKPDGSFSSSNGHSSHLTNGNSRHRSASQTWSERAPFRHHSTVSSSETNGTVIINGNRHSNGTSTYAPGLQRVIQSSTWYKPKAFAVDGSNALSPPSLSRRIGKCNLIIIIVFMSEK